jgi:hypothetical protein
VPFGAKTGGLGTPYLRAGVAERRARRNEESAFAFPARKPPAQFVPAFARFLVRNAG